MANYTRIKYVPYKAHLLNDTFANFFTKFHDADHTLDPLYKKLYPVCKNVLEASRIAEHLFKTPYNTDGFWFKPDPAISCTKLDGSPCIIDDLFDLDVVMDLCVYPYDFMDKKTKSKKAGVTIKVKRIRQLKTA